MSCAIRVVVCETVTAFVAYETDNASDFRSMREFDFNESSIRPSSSRLSAGLGAEEIFFWWQRMLAAVNVVHDHDIVHCDLKPHNFILFRQRRGRDTGAPVLFEHEQYTLKLSDFGVSRQLEDSATHVSEDAPIGTVRYMAPEVVHDCRSNCKLWVGKAADNWSIGVIMHQMLHRGLTPHSHVERQRRKVRLMLAIACRKSARVKTCCPRLLQPPSSTGNESAARLASLRHDVLMGLQFRCLHFFPKNRASTQHLASFTDEMKRFFSGGSVAIADLSADVAPYQVPLNGLPTDGTTDIVGDSEQEALVVDRNDVGIDHAADVVGMFVLAQAGEAEEPRRRSPDEILRAEETCAQGFMMVVTNDRDGARAHAEAEGDMESKRKGDGYQLPSESDRGGPNSTINGSRTDIVGNSEQEGLLVDWNDVGTDHAADIVGMFDAQAGEKPRRSSGGRSVVPRVDGLRTPDEETCAQGLVMDVTNDKDTARAHAEAEGDLEREWDGHQMASGGNKGATGTSYSNGCASGASGGDGALVGCDAVETSSSLSRPAAEAGDNWPLIVDLEAGDNSSVIDANMQTVDIEAARIGESIGASSFPEIWVSSCEDPGRSSPSSERVLDGGSSASAVPLVHKEVRDLEAARSDTVSEEDCERHGGHLRRHGRFCQALALVAVVLLSIGGLSCAIWKVASARGPSSPGGEVKDDHKDPSSVLPPPPPPGAAGGGGRTEEESPPPATPPHPPEASPPPPGAPPPPPATPPHPPEASTHPPGAPPPPPGAPPPPPGAPPPPRQDGPLLPSQCGGPPPPPAGPRPGGVRGTGGARGPSSLPVVHRLLAAKPSSWRSAIACRDRLSRWREALAAEDSSSVPSTAPVVSGQPPEIGSSSSISTTDPGGGAAGGGGILGGGVAAGGGGAAGDGGASGSGVAAGAGRGDGGASGSGGAAGAGRGDGGASGSGGAAGAGRGDGGASGSGVAAGGGRGDGGASGSGGAAGAGRGDGGASGSGVAAGGGRGDGGASGNSALTSSPHSNSVSSISSSPYETIMTMDPRIEDKDDATRIEDIEPLERLLGRFRPASKPYEALAELLERFRPASLHTVSSSTMPDPQVFPKSVAPYPQLSRPLSTGCPGPASWEINFSRLTGISSPGFLGDQLPSDSDSGGPNATINGDGASAGCDAVETSSLSRPAAEAGDNSPLTVDFKAGDRLVKTLLAPQLAVALAEKDETKVTRLFSRIAAVSETAAILEGGCREAMKALSRLAKEDDAIIVRSEGEGDFGGFGSSRGRKFFGSALVSRTDPRRKNHLGGGRRTVTISAAHPRTRI